MRVKIGILLAERHSPSRFQRQRQGYFFCNTCESRFRDGYYIKKPVYADQFPEEFSQKCHTQDCEVWLRETGATQLYERWQDILIPDEFRMED